MGFFEANKPLLPEIFALHGKWRPTQDAVICEGDRLSWKAFVGANHQFANGLLDRGIQHGDAIGVVMSNGIPMLQALMGAMAAGIVSVPINLSVNDDALVAMLEDANVTALVATSDQIPRLNALKERLPDSVKLFISDQAQDAPWLDIASLLEGQPITQPDVTIADYDVLNIIYSSGTTGNPKGIVHSHGGRRDWAYDLAIALRYHCSSRTLLTLGLYSNISWVTILTTLLAGGTLVIHKRFDAALFLQSIAQESITHVGMVPIQFQRAVEVIEQDASQYDLSSMQSMMSVGSPLHVEIKQKLFKYFSCGIIELYGLTEGVITSIDPEQAEGRWSSVGRPLMGTDILIVDENDTVLSAGQSGELVARGRFTMPGYLNRPDANQEAAYKDERGKLWLRTGDIGYVDEEGFLYIVDRKKDMILSGGQNIYPQDIEAIIVQNDAVNEVAVIAAKSTRWSETPIALVVKHAKTNASAKEIMSWANERLGKQQRIADVIFIDEIPRNPNGKILKRQLRVDFSDNVYD